MERYDIDFIVDGKKVNTYRLETNKTKTNKIDICLKFLCYVAKIFAYIIVGGVVLMAGILEAIAKGSKKK